MPGEGLLGLLRLEPLLGLERGALIFVEAPAQVRVKGEGAGTGGESSTRPGLQCTA